MVAPVLAAAAMPAIMGAIQGGGASQPGGASPTTANKLMQHAESTSSASLRASSGAGDRGNFYNTFAPHGSGEINAPSANSWKWYVLAGCGALAVMIFLRNR